MKSSARHLSQKQGDNKKNGDFPVGSFYPHPVDNYSETVTIVN
jgi:hypothetical protein